MACDEAILPNRQELKHFRMSLIWERFRGVKGTFYMLHPLSLVNTLDQLMLFRDQDSHLLGSPILY